MDYSRIVLYIFQGLAVFKTLKTFLHFRVLLLLSRLSDRAVVEIVTFWDLLQDHSVGFGRVGILTFVKIKIVTR